MPKEDSRIRQWLPLAWAAMLCVMAATLCAFVEVYLLHCRSGLLGSPGFSAYS